MRRGKCLWPWKARHRRYVVSSAVTVLNMPKLHVADRAHYASLVARALGVYAVLDEQKLVLICGAFFPLVLSTLMRLDAKLAHHLLAQVESEAWTLRHSDRPIRVRYGGRY